MLNNLTVWVANSNAYYSLDMNITLPTVKHTAQGPYLGFALQPVRLCTHLLQCPEGAAVSLELLDDVAVHLADGTVEVEQIKSATRQNPISDWSDELWKTFANWFDAIAAGHLIIGFTRFILYVTPPRTGEWVEALSNASTDAEVDEIVATIEAKLNRLRTPKACDSNLRRFLEAPRALRHGVVLNFKLASSDTDPLDQIRDLIRPTVSPELVEAICAYAIGMAKERVDRKIRDRQPPILDGNWFKREFQAFVRKTNTPGLLTSFTRVPEAQEIDALLSARPIFIRQLELVGLESQDYVRAVSDYLRTSADKTAWAETGSIFEESLIDWDEFLVSRHGLIAGEVADIHGEKDARIRGRLTYRECAQVQASLDSRSVPSHFVHGSFNALADDMRVGWHPDYQKLIGENGNE
jgi:hypothetical protein